MDKMTFASYKFNPSDVIEGLNRYFAEAKAFRYLRASLEIKNGEVKPGNYYVFRNVVFVSMSSAPKVKECGYYYIICDPEEVVGVAINWLREEHDIFYTPGMEAPREDRDIFCMENLKETKNFSITIDDFCVDEAAREYEKRTRSQRDLKETLQRRLYEAKRRIVALEEGHKEKSKIIDRQKTVIKELEERLHEANEELADHRVAEGWLRKENSDLAIKVSNLEEQLRVLRYDILEVYREIFDCSNGDPEGTDEETLQDILTEYKRVLKLKNVAEEKTIKWKELALENEEKARKYKDTAKENRIQWNNTNAQLQWAQKENLEWLKRYEKLKSELNEMTKRYGGSVITSGGLCEDLTKEREKVRMMEQKLMEIKDICER